MKLWIDDVRLPPSQDFVWIKSVQSAKMFIEECEYMQRCSRRKDFWIIEIIDIDHDAGEFANRGGDYIKLLDWLEETGRNYPIRIHSQNPVGIQNMRRIIKKNNWQEIL